MSRGSLLIILAVLCIAMACALVAPAYLSFFAVVCGQGLILVIWLALAAMTGAALLRAAGTRVGGSLGLASATALGLGVFSLAALGLGLAGWLNRYSAIAVGLAGAAAYIAGLLRQHGNVPLENHTAAVENWLRTRAEAWWIWLLVAPFLTIAVVAASLPPASLWPHDPVPYDVLEYHLQVPREWYEAGRILPLRHNVFSFFPFNMEMQYLLAMHIRGGPWEAIYLSQYLTLAHMAMMAVAVHGIATALATPESAGRSGALATAAVAAVPWVVTLGSVAYNEAALLLYATLAIGWVLPWVGGAGGLRKLAVAGGFAGLACGSKYTAVPMLLVGLPAAMGAVRLGLIASGPDRIAQMRRTVAGCAVVVAAGLLAVCPWLIRNWVWTGNPVFPEAMPLLGSGHFTPQQVDRWQRAHSPRPDQRPLVMRFLALSREVLADWRFGGLWPPPREPASEPARPLVLLWPLAVVGLAVSWRRPQVWLLCGMALLLIVFWLSLTHLQSRFFVMAVPLAAVLVAQLARSRTGAVVALGALLFMAVPSIIGLHRGLRLPLGHVAAADLFGFKDLMAFVRAPELEEALAPGNRLMLVGEAQAFLFTTPPLAEVRYRTVFDVAAEPGQSAVDAWLGADAAEIRRHFHLLIDHAELARLAGYAHIPPHQARGGVRYQIVPPGGSTDTSRR